MKHSSPSPHCNIRLSFAMAFRNWRVGKNIPLKQVAADLGLAMSTVSLWETGRRFPTGKHLEMLSQYTGLPPCRLFCVMSEKCIPDDCFATLQRINKNLPPDDPAAA